MSHVNTDLYKILFIKCGLQFVIYFFLQKGHFYRKPYKMPLAIDSSFIKCRLRFYKMLSTASGFAKKTYKMSSLVFDFYK